MGTRRLAAVLVATACVLGSARLWSDALTPAAVPFVEPLTSSGGHFNPPPRTVVVATAEPRVRPAAPKVVRKTHAKAAPVAIPRVKVVAPAQASAASTPQAPPTAAPPVQPPEAKPPATPSNPPAPAPQPSPPAPLAPSAPVVQVAAAPAAPSPAPPPVEPAAQPSDSRPGWGKGDENHKHTGPPGQQGS